MGDEVEEVQIPIDSKITNGDEQTETVRRNVANLKLPKGYQITKFTVKRPRYYPARKGGLGMILDCAHHNYGTYTGEGAFFLVKEFINPRDIVLMEEEGYLTEENFRERPRKRPRRRLMNRLMRETERLA